MQILGLYSLYSSGQIDEEHELWRQNSGEKSCGSCDTKQKIPAVLNTRYNEQMDGNLANVRFINPFTQAIPSIFFWDFLQCIFLISNLNLRGCVSEKETHLFSVYDKLTPKCSTHLITRLCLPFFLLGPKVIIWKIVWRKKLYSVTSWYTQKCSHFKETPEIYNIKMQFIDIKFLFISYSDYSCILNKDAHIC